MRALLEFFFADRPSSGKHASDFYYGNFCCGIYFSEATVTFNPSLYPPLDECYLTLIVCFHNDNGTFLLRPAPSSCFHPTCGFKLRRTLQSSDEVSSRMSPVIRLREYVSSCTFHHPIGRIQWIFGIFLLAHLL